jgi:hypothetical protein
MQIMAAAPTQWVMRTTGSSWRRGRVAGFGKAGILCGSWWRAAGYMADKEGSQRLLPLEVRASRPTSAKWEKLFGSFFKKERLSSLA